MAIVNWTSEAMNWDNLISPGHETPGRYMEALRQSLLERVSAAQLPALGGLGTAPYPRAGSGGHIIHTNDSQIGGIFNGIQFERQMDILLDSKYINQDTFSIGGLPTIPMWNEADMLTKISAASRLLIIEKDIPIKEWARQQYDMLNILLWVPLLSGLTTSPFTAKKGYVNVNFSGESGNVKTGEDNSTFAAAVTDYDNTPSFSTTGFSFLGPGPDLVSANDTGAPFQYTLENRIGVVSWRDGLNQKIWNGVTSRISYYAKPQIPQSGTVYNAEGTGLVEDVWQFLEELPLSVAANRQGNIVLIDESHAGSGFSDPGVDTTAGVQFSSPLTVCKWDQGTIGVDGFKYRI